MDFGALKGLWIVVVSLGLIAAIILLVVGLLVGGTLY